MNETMKVMKIKKIYFLISFLLIVLASTGYTQTTPPCYYPPFITQAVTPNVLLLVDCSGSMNWQAYYGDYDPNKRYYGYADPDKYYQYRNNVFEITTTWSGTADPDNMRFSGNFLNWMAMRRVDILRKVLIGGKCESRTGSGPKILVGEQTDNASARSFYKYYGDWRYYLYGGDIIGYKRVGSSWSQRWTCKVKIRGPEVVEGFVQRTADRVRYGLEFFNYGNKYEQGGPSDGGRIVDYIGTGSTINNIVNHIENFTPNTWTPIAESFYEAVIYFQAGTSYYNGGINYAAHDPQLYWCQKNFVILITDGESTMDRNIPSWLRDYDGDGQDPVPPGENPNEYPWNEYGSDYLNDVALYAHTQDLRPDMQGKQTITLFAIYCFGNEPAAVRILQRGVIAGGFDDVNGNNRPDLQAEWDSDNDGTPDNYFNAMEGDDFEKALTSAYMEIMRRISAASAVSIVTGSTKGEGTIFQAYFLPARTTIPPLTWVGYFHSLWIDGWGNLREDSDNDAKLDVDDKIVQIYFSGDVGTRVRRYTDDNDNGIPDELVDDVPIDSLHSVWNAGKLLWNRNPNTRNIYGILKSGGTVIKKEFTTSNKSDFLPHLAVSSAKADTLIRYVRGEDFPQYRSRTDYSKVWKLADIIYSTPTYVAEPSERYDLIYDDASYREYFRKYRSRMGIVYVGSNDGILHAFNAGRYYESLTGGVKGYLEKGDYNLGEEIWGIIPFNLLPHLQWLMDPKYCHVYYVDNKPKVCDAKIFANDNVHPGGWGTVLISSSRLGGSPYTIGSDTYRSSLLALDVTVPDNPIPMWEYNSDDLGFTTCYPQVVKCDTAWFVVFGSGPTTLTGTSSQSARIFVLDLKTGALLRKFILSTSNSFLSDPVAGDVDLNYSTDVIYFGETRYSGGVWSGSIYRLSTNESVNPYDWTLSTLVDIGRPVTSMPAITLDKDGKLWVFVGTGRYFNDDDETDTQGQYFMGIKDPYWRYGSGSVQLSQLLDCTAIEVYATDTGVVVTGFGPTQKSYSDFLAGVASYGGWRYSLFSGERVIAKPVVLGSVVFFTSFSPSSDVCAFGGTSKLWGLYYKTGTAHPMKIFGMEESTKKLTKSVPMGEGVPTAPTLHIGSTDQATVTDQLSTGQLFQNRANVKPPKSEMILWKVR